MTDSIVGQKRLVIVIQASGTYPVTRVFFQRPTDTVDEMHGDKFCVKHPSRMAEAQKITPLRPQWTEGICQNPHCWKVKNEEPCHRYRGRVEFDDVL